MDTELIIEEIKKQMTGDPQKDGPFLKSQADKYKNAENSDEINKELARLLYDCAYEDMHKTIDNYLAVENPKVNEKLVSVKKRYNNLNFGGGLEILREIIKNNLFAWIDDDETTYKSFGTPLEHALYLQVYQPEKNIKPVTCNLSEVYSLYGWGLIQRKKYTESIDAFQRAIELNPTDPEIYIKYCELLKQIKQADELKEATDKIMQYAVTKKQLANGYFNYSFYYSEKNDYDKAAAMLEMSRIFYDNTELIENEMQYISNCIGLGAVPPSHNAEQLMTIIQSEGIPAGPSALVVNTAYALAKQAQRTLNPQLALYYLEIVWELTEDDKIEEEMYEIRRAIKNN